MNKVTESPNDKSVEFLCNKTIGRIILHFILFIRIPKLIGFFLRTPLSLPLVKRFINKNKINMSDFEGQKFSCFNDFFTREKSYLWDENSNSFISPCDSLLSVYKITGDSVFSIKGFDYTLKDFFDSDSPETVEIIKRFEKGYCLVFRLRTTDYHRYCYVDNGYQNENHFIEGSLYSVQPAACENFRVYTKNRRSWTILETENFGTVAQIEVGAFSVGGIKNHYENAKFSKGAEKGYFDLRGSTIVLLVEPDKISLLEEFNKKNEEHEVSIGQRIGIKCKTEV